MQTGKELKEGPQRVHYECLALLFPMLTLIMCQTLYGKKHKATYTHRSCLDVESHAMKLPAHSLCADVNARGEEELYSYWFNRVLVTFRHYALRCNFSWSASSWVSCCGFLMLHFIFRPWHFSIDFNIFFIDSKYVDETRFCPSVLDFQNSWNKEFAVHLQLHL